MKRNYDVTYTVTYHCVVAANSEREAKEAASNGDSWEAIDSTDYEVDEVCEEPDDT